MIRVVRVIHVIRVIRVIRVVRVIRVIPPGRVCDRRGRVCWRVREAREQERRGESLWGETRGPYLKFCVGAIRAWNWPAIRRLMTFRTRLQFDRNSSKICSPISEPENGGICEIGGVRGVEFAFSGGVVI